MAPATGGTLYTIVVLKHGAKFPVNVPGAGKVLLTVISCVLGGEVPHEPFATTDIVPLLLFEVTVMELVVELPVQPEGKVQV